MGLEIFLILRVGSGIVLSLPAPTPIIYKINLI